MFRGLWLRQTYITILFFKAGQRFFVWIFTKRVLKKIVNLLPYKTSTSRSAELTLKGDSEFLMTSK